MKSDTLYLEVWNIGNASLLCKLFGLNVDRVIQWFSLILVLCFYKISFHKHVEINNQTLKGCFTDLFLMLAFLQNNLGYYYNTENKQKYK